MRRAARVDANHAMIVMALRQAGASVQDLAKVGKGCPDLIVGYRGINYLLEVKVTKGRATLTQLEWHGAWRGQVAVVRSVEEALRVIGAIQ